MAKKVEYLGNDALWRLRESIAIRRELSRRWRFYALAAEALRKLLIKQMKAKYSTARP